ncbi:ATPase WRNIP1 [Acipenser ruthenus]|uniref:ATPase WRNIP1 n=1 Tax=Acipenser ruthenus TaxID=7906 RepID=A0A444UL18_ACIRT|nr:ATPase WRNIP1 [Acipenser ruthenus]
MAQERNTDTVKCPVCLSDFEVTIINSHLDSCLQQAELNDQIQETDSNIDDTAPPCKKTRISYTVAGPTSGSGVELNDANSKKLAIKTCTSAPKEKESRGGDPHSSTVFPLFQKSKPTSSGESDSKIFFSSKPGNSGKTTPATESVMNYKGMKRSTPNDKMTLIYSSNTGPTNDTRNLAQPMQTRTLDKLFDNKPLAEKMRPNTLEYYFGQNKVLGENTMLRSLVETHDIPSLLLWGPPGCGKTTLAHIIASNSKSSSNSRFVALSATSASTNDVREVIKQSQNELRLFKRKTILFIDEIHRFNKTQQDTFLPHVECGTITLIGATTENPSFQVNAALLSRCSVIVLEKLSVEAMETILIRAVHSLGIRVLGEEEDVVGSLDSSSSSEVFRNKYSTWQTINRPAFIFMYISGEEHYNCISALHKSMRGSDENASLYWLGRMLEGGEDPLYVARRLVRFASEDVGMADPMALTQAVSAFQASHFIGMPECEVILAQCVVYLARAPKSVDIYKAYGNVKACLRTHKGPLPSVPLHLRNAPTKLMKNLGYAKGYKYNPAFSEPVEQDYLPEELKGINFFTYAANN